MKYVKKLKLLFVIFIIIFSFNVNSFARYYQDLEMFSGKFKIAEPILIVKQLEQEKIIDVNRETVNEEYSFLIKNYRSENQVNKPSEVPLEIEIEITHTNNNFPIECKLYDCNTGEELLQGNYKTSTISISENTLFERQYRLIISWKDKETMSSMDDIDIIITANQKLN